MAWKNDQQRKALAEKLNHPDHRVICPTCSDELRFEKIGNSSIAECRKCKVFAGARGL